MLEKSFHRKDEDKGIVMDGDVQRQITLACIGLLQKDAVEFQRERKRTGWRSPTTKREAIELLLKAASEPDITFEHVTDALWIIFKRSRPVSQTREWVTQLLFDLGQQEDITASDAVEVARTLYSLSPQGSPKRQEAVQ